MTVDTDCRDVASIKYDMQMLHVRWNGMHNRWTENTRNNVIMAGMAVFFTWLATS